MRINPTFPSPNILPFLSSSTLKQLLPVTVLLLQCLDAKQQVQYITLYMENALTIRAEATQPDFI